MHHSLPHALNSLHICMQLRHCSRLIFVSSSNIVTVDSIDAINKQQFNVVFRSHYSTNPIATTFKEIANRAHNGIFAPRSLNIESWVHLLLGISIHPCYHRDFIWSTHSFILSFIHKHCLSSFIFFTITAFMTITAKPSIS